MEDKWTKLEEVVRRVVRDELSTWEPQKKKDPIRFEDGKFTGLTEAVISRLQETYQAVDVRRQLAEMEGWLLLNPTDAPKSKFGAFISKWLTKHQNAASLRLIPTTRSSQGAAPNVCAYCLSPATSAVNGYRHCRDRSCFEKAMSGERPPKMPGILPKQMAGADG